VVTVAAAMAAADLAVAETVVAPTTVNRDFRNISAQTFVHLFHSVQ
jgi:hypothetical protein